MEMKGRQDRDNPQVSWERLRDLPLEKFPDLKVLVLGDFMLDEYIWGRVERISPEAPVAVVDVERETRTMGGAGNVANNLAALGAQVEVLALTGEDNPAGLLQEELNRLGIDSRGLFHDPQRRTTRKTRVVANQQQVVRIDRETRIPGPAAFETWALGRLEALLPTLNALILSDYGKGTLTPSLLQEAIRRARSQGLPVVVDPKGTDYSPYAGATVITPNHKEMEAVVGRPLRTWEELVDKGRELRERLGLDFLLITQGAEGMTLLRQGGPLRIPARTPREVFDVSGAGDTVVAVLALGLAQWGEAAVAAALANLAAGVVVTKKGTAPILRSEMERELRGHVHLEEKIVTLKELGFVISHLKAQGKKVVFTNGCFDLLHAGHIKFLEDSRRLGDVLVVALDADASVARVKGEGRPVIGQEQRLRILGALEVVDYVTLFDSEQLPEILRNLQPDILTKGSNYPEAEVAGREIVQAYGGQVKLLPVTEPVSVSDLINRIRGD
ncbi:MAG: D-glycero-beta-D-manno-heptose-7-phosphate kinase [Syntrophales bacterium]|nr:D-glycero-beta-D-manno-heptose-7-phosphate kinase [Syntrophales bacterium]